MFDRLMRRAVFAKPDRIMRQHIDGPHTHQSREADCRARIIGKDQKCAAIGDETAMQREAVHRRRHAEFADAVMNIGAAVILARHARRASGMVSFDWVKSAEPPMRLGSPWRS